MTAWRTTLPLPRCAVDVQLESLLQDLLKRAMQIVRQEQQSVLALADALLAQRMLDRAAVDTIFNTHWRAAQTTSGATTMGIDAVGLTVAAVDLASLGDPALLSQCSQDTGPDAPPAPTIVDR